MREKGKGRGGSHQVSHTRHDRSTFGRGSENREKRNHRVYSQQHERKDRFANAYKELPRNF